MRGVHVCIDAGALRDLYVDQQLSIAAVADRFQCSPTTIGRCLRRLSIARRRRGPRPGGYRRPFSGSETVWSRDVAYVVGLIATDGNLSKKPGRLAIVSKDADLLETVKQCLRLTASIGAHEGGFGSHCHRLAWSDREFYDWLLGLGLTPAKSLTLGPLDIPDDYFADFLRGCLDGDGSITTYTDRYNTAKDPAYVYTRLYVSIFSASRPFLAWLRDALRRLRGVAGHLLLKRSPGRNDMWHLRYAKRESLALLRWIYYEAAVPCLERKRVTAAPFLTPPSVSPVRRRGRPVVV